MAAVIQTARTLAEREPALAYYGASFWSAWMLLSVNGFGRAAVGAPSSDGLGSVAVVQWAFIAGLLLCAALGARTSRFLASPARLSATGLAGLASSASLGILLLSGWNETAVLTASVAVGVCMAGLFVASAMLYVRLEPRRAMMRYMLSQVFAGFLWLLVESLSKPVGVGAYAALPLCAAALFALGWLSRTDGAGGAARLRAHRPLADLRGPIVRLMVAMLLIRVAANVHRQFVATSLGEDALVGAIACKIILSGLLALYAATATRTVGYGRVCYIVMLLISATIAAVPLAGGGLVSYAAVSGLSGLSGNLAFLIFAYICRGAREGAGSAESCADGQESDAPGVLGAVVPHIFGIGYAAVFVGSTAGRQIGAALASAQATSPFDTDLLALAVAYGLLLMTLAVLPPREVARLSVPLPAPTHDDGRPWRNSEALDQACSELSGRLGLTARESETLALLVAGYDSGYISMRLGISLNTVRTHVRNVYAKAGVHSKAELELLVEGAAEKGA